MSAIYYQGNTRSVSNHLYYNAIIANTTDKPVVSNYTDDRQDSFISVPQDWAASVVRAEINGHIKFNIR